MRIRFIIKIDSISLACMTARLEVWGGGGGGGGGRRQEPRHTVSVLPSGPGESSGE